MSLTISSRVLSDAVVVHLAGRLTFLDVALRERIDEWLKEGHRAFILDFADVPYVDSFGLGQLITILNSIRSKGGHLVLVGLVDQVRALFQITRLDTVFIISTEADAITSLHADVIEPVLPALSAKSHLP